MPHIAHLGIEDPTVNYYSIKDLEKLTGIKAHTIRMWEKRYRLIEPERTDTNIRRYDQDALKKILMVSSLNNKGIKISKLAKLSGSDLHSQFTGVAAEQTSMDMFIDQLVVAMVDMDERAFSQLLEDFSNWYGFERTVTEIFFPFCEKIGVMWLIDKIHPAHEHFISNMIRVKLFSEINEIPIPQEYNKPSVVLFLREGEYHEIGLIFYYYLLKLNGYKTIYLGQNLPLNDLQDVTEFYNAAILVTALITKLSDEDAQEWLNALANAFPEKKIYISGQQAAEINVELPPNVEHLKTAAELSFKIKSNLLSGYNV